MNEVKFQRERASVIDKHKFRLSGIIGNVTYHGRLDQAGIVPTGIDGRFKRGLGGRLE